MHNQNWLIWLWKTRSLTFNLITAWIQSIVIFWTERWISDLLCRTTSPAICALCFYLFCLGLIIWFVLDVVVCSYCSCTWSDLFCFFKIDPFTAVLIYKIQTLLYKYRISPGVRVLFFFLWWWWWLCVWATLWMFWSERTNEAPLLTHSLSLRWRRIFIAHIIKCLVCGVWKCM